MNGRTPPLPRDESVIAVDAAYLSEWALRLLQVHSPTGYTDPVTRMVGEELTRLGIRFELTRRGAIRATIQGMREAPARAMVAHLDTLGAMVRELKPNGRLAIKAVGTWSSRFAEGARVSVFTDTALFRGTILPLKASGHVFHEEVDSQPVNWDQLEVRVDDAVWSRQDLIDIGMNVGDFVGVDACPELMANGFLNSRHLDDKAGVAILLAVLKALHDSEPPPVDLHALFTISEEVGSGASAVLRGNVSEMVSIDNGTVAPGQESSELWPSVCLGDSTGPMDYHLTRSLLQIARENQILHGRDVFRYYRCDSASAVEAGNDIRTALVTFGVDASHGYERTHLDGLRRAAQLLIAYIRSPVLFDVHEPLIPSLDEFPETRETVPQGVEAEVPGDVTPGEESPHSP